MEEIQQLIEVKFKEMENSMATKECINDLKLLITQQNTVIQEQDKKIEKLESTVAVLQASVAILKKNTEENEQYGRRLCLLLDGIDTSNNESADVYV